MRRLLPGNGTENAARCTGPRSTLHEPSQRAASAIAPHCPSQAGSDEGKQQSKGAIRPARWTNSRPPLCPQARSIRRSTPSAHSETRTAMPHQKHRGLLIQGSSPKLCNSPFTTSESRIRNRMELSSTHILPHSPSERSTVPDPKYCFCNQAVAQFLTRNATFAIRAQRVLQGEQALCLTPPGTKG